MPATELSVEQLKQLRASLEGRRETIEAHLSASTESTQPVTLDQQSVGRVSRIDAIQQQQMAIASHLQAQQLLRQVDLAIERVESGEYGFCGQCDEAIAFGRLQAQPFATFCIDCQSANESG